VETAHEYFNLISGLLDLVIVGALLVASRRLVGEIPRVVWILAGFFFVSGLGYLNEPSPVFGSNATIAVILDVARIAFLVLVAYITPGLVRGLVGTIRTARYQAADHKQAMLDRHYEM
jgi:hypothetical protein